MDEKEQGAKRLDDASVAGRQTVGGRHMAIEEVSLAIRRQRRQLCVQLVGQ